MASLVQQRILFVCTANMCRSPLAEAIARRAAEGSELSFSSAGLIPGGASPPSVGLRVAKERGLDLAGHVSRELHPSDIAAADVILTMSRAHSLEIVAREPSAWPRVFTVKQFARWLADRTPPRHDSLRQWIASEAAHRPRSELFGTYPADDIADPMNTSARFWRRVAGELQENIETIVAALTVTSSSR